MSGFTVKFEYCSTNAGLSYDMRGKRFLDALLIQSGATSQKQGGSNGSSSSHPSRSDSPGRSLWAASANILTLGYLGGGAGKKSGQVAQSNGNNSSSSSGNGSAATPPRSSKRYSSQSDKAPPAYQNILFIQEPSTLLLISQDKTNNKIGPSAVHYSGSNMK